MESRFGVRCLLLLISLEAIGCLVVVSAPAVSETPASDASGTLISETTMTTSTTAISTTANNTEVFNTSSSHSRKSTTSTTDTAMTPTSENKSETLDKNSKHHKDSKTLMTDVITTTVLYETSDTEYSIENPDIRAMTGDHQTTTESLTDPYCQTITLSRPVVHTVLVLIVSTVFLHTVIIAYCVLSIWQICTSKPTAQEKNKTTGESDTGTDSEENTTCIRPVDDDEINLRRREKRSSVHSNSCQSSENETPSQSLALTNCQEGFLNLDSAINRGKYSKRASLRSPHSHTEQTEGNSHSRSSSTHKKVRRTSRSSGTEPHVAIQLPTITVEPANNNEIHSYPDAESSSPLQSTWSPEPKTTLQDGYAITLEDHSVSHYQDTQDFSDDSEDANGRQRHNKNGESERGIMVNTVEADEFQVQRRDRCGARPHCQAVSPSHLSHLNHDSLVFAKQSHLTPGQPRSYREDFCYMTEPKMLTENGVAEARVVAVSKRPLSTDNVNINNDARQSSASFSQHELVDDVNGLMGPSVPRKGDAPNLFDAFESEPIMMESWNIPTNSAAQHTSCPPQAPSSRRFSSYESSETQRNLVPREQRWSVQNGANIVRLLRQGWGPETSV